MTKASIAWAMTLAFCLGARAVTFEPETSDDAPPPDEWTTPEVSFDLTARLALDTAFDSPGENVASLLRRARLSVATSKGALHLKLGLRLRWLTTMESLSGARRRSALEPQPGETEVAFSAAGIAWTAGLLDVAWGENPAFAPADVLTPLDLRDGPLGGPDARLVVPALRAQGAIGWLHWDAVYLPLFEPSKLPMFGNDWGPFVPGRATVVPDLSPSVDATTLPSLEQQPFVTKSPQLDLTAPQGGLRLSVRPSGSSELALTWAEVFDRQPRYTFSPAFERFSAALQQNDRSGMLLALIDLQGETDRGVAPLTAEYVRTRVFALDGAVSAGKLRFTLDAGYSPVRVFPTVDLHTVLHPLASGALGLEYEGPPTLAAGVATYAVFDVGADERLLYLDLPNPPAVRRDVVLPLAYLVASERLCEDRLTLLVTALASSRGDFLAVPQAAWAFSDAQSLSAGALFLGGPPEGLGWTYHHNDEAFLAYHLAL